MKRGKKYKKIIEKMDNNISFNNSFEEVKKLSLSKFPGSVEIHIALNINQKNTKQVLRGSVNYKNKVGEKKRVLLLTDSKDIKPETAKKYDYIGLEEYIDKINQGWSDFDVIIATPNVMSKIAVLGKILGPKDLMPNPKKGTITDNIDEAINSYMGGKFDYKSDQTGVIHTIIGNVNNTKEELLENTLLLIKSIISVVQKPENTIFKSIYICPTMGPSIKIKSEELITRL